MIFTFGNTENYLKGFSEQKREEFQKLGRTKGYKGGAAFKTKKAALNYIRDNPEYSVFGVLADWEKDTEKAPGKPFNYLLRTSELVLLDSNGKSNSRN